MNQIQLRWKDEKTNKVYYQITLDFPIDRTTEQSTQEDTTQTMLTHTDKLDITDKKKVIHIDTKNIPVKTATQTKSKQEKQEKIDYIYNLLIGKVCNKPQQKGC